MKKVIYAFAFCVTLLGCNQNKKEKETKTEKQPQTISSNDLIGSWKNISMKVTMKLDDRDSVLNVPKGKWQEILKIKPIETKFNKDGTYTSTYRSLDGQIFMTTNGSWELKGNKLKMVSEAKKYAYTVSIKEGVATFKGKIDWDEDGQVDDLYIGKQRKTNKKKIEKTKV